MENFAIQIIPDKVQYVVGDRICLEILGMKPGPKDSVAVSLFCYTGQEIPITDVRFRNNYIVLPEDFSRREGGYLVRAVFLREAIELCKAYTAFDISDNWEKAPRYGFLCDFCGRETDDRSYSDFFRRMHLNGIQFYDWMYRHDDFFPESDIYTDIMGRKGTMSAVRSKIGGVHACGGKAIAYGAVYGAESFQEEHPECRYLYDNGDPMVFIDKIWLMDIHKGTAWREKILEEYEKALDYGFDGIHMDQYGDPKEALVCADGRLAIRDLAEDFRDLIDDGKSRNSNKTFIFNAVNNWPVDSVAKSMEDCVYIEVWSPNDTYGDLFRLIRHARCISGQKQVILAAYLHPFKTEPEINLKGSTAQLAMAAIFASGGFHLLLGEEGRILTEAYYPDNCLIGRGRLWTDLKKYYDFITAYGELLFPKEWTDVTTQYVGGINTEFSFANIPWSVYPEAGKVWIRIYKRGREFSVRYVNFVGIHDMNWNSSHPDMPKVQSKLETQIKLPGKKIHICFVSPDTVLQEPVLLDHTAYVGEDKHQRILYELPSLAVFAVVYIKIEQE